MVGSGTCCMKERLRFIEEYRQHRQEQSMASLCRAARISRKTGYEWVRRFERGWDGRSARSGRRAWVITEKAAKMILGLREHYPLEGPRKLVVRLHGLKRRPAASTVGDFLRRQGLVAKRRRRRHPVPMTQPLGHAVKPNDLWTVDRKGWFRTADGRICEPLTVMDGASRYLLYNRHLSPVTYCSVRAIFEQLFRLHGMPAAIRSDNGPPFAGIGAAGLSKLALWWIKLGIKVERTAPAHPEQNGRHERMHLTLKQHVCVRVGANLRAQQRMLERFRIYYNSDRPHQALGQATPASVYHRSPRPYPARVPAPAYPEDWEVRRVRSNGTIKWQGRTIYISQALSGERVGLVSAADRGLRVQFATVELGQLDQQRWKLRYQPRPRTARAREKPAVTRSARRPRLNSSISVESAAQRRTAAGSKGNFFRRPPQPVRGRRKKLRG